MKQHLVSHVRQLERFSATSACIITNGRSTTSDFSSPSAKKYSIEFPKLESKQLLIYVRTETLLQKLFQYAIFDFTNFSSKQGLFTSLEHKYPTSTYRCSKPYGMPYD